MRRGFNKYSQNGEEESPSENLEDQNPQGIGSMNYGMVSQFAQFGSGAGYNDGMMVTLFQIVEQQSRALQSLVAKVDSITQKTLDLTEKIRDIKYLTINSEKQNTMRENPSARRRGKAGSRVKL
jgi:hypothetical protein